MHPRRRAPLTLPAVLSLACLAGAGCAGPPALDASVDCPPAPRPGLACVTHCGPGDIPGTEEQCLLFCGYTDAGGIECLEADGGRSNCTPVRAPDGAVLAFC